MKRRFGAAFAAGMAVTSATAQSGPSLALGDFTEEQRVYLGRLGNALSTSRNCDFSLDNEAIKATARPVFGADAFGFSKAFNLLYVADGFSGLADSVLFPSERGKAKQCADMLRLYGPTGTVLKGVLKP